MTKILTIISLLISLASIQASASNLPIVIGVLEKPQCIDKAGTIIRALFSKNNQGWVSLDTESVFQQYITKSMTWIIAFDGKDEGEIKTIDPGFSTEYPWTFPRDRVLDLSKGQQIPNYPNKLQRFSGWCWAPPIRPVIVVSGGGVFDPDIWKPYKASVEEFDLVFNAFKAKVGSVNICPNLSEKGIPFNYTVKDTEILGGYKDKAGRKLISLRFKPLKETDYCGEVVEPEWESHWFLLSDNVSYIGTGLELVDAGDYDNDGQSEIVFWYSGYNRDGYILIYDNFSRKAEYLWGYH